MDEGSTVSNDLIFIFSFTVFLTLFILSIKYNWFNLFAKTGGIADLKEEKRTSEWPISQPATLTVIQPSLSDDPEFKRVVRMMEMLPQKVVESVTSSTNQQKGRLGELIGYIHLNSQYDRLIVLRDMTDYVGIRLPKDGDPGCIDFIDIKNGPHARLTKDQVELKKVIDGGNINFRTYRIETEAPSTDSRS